MINDRKSTEESTGYWVSRLARSMERDFESRLQSLEITRGAFAVLSAIHYDKNSKPADLAAFLGVDGAAVTRHLDRIEKKGLVERVLSTTDRRSFDINVTAKGRKMLKLGSTYSQATNRKFTANLSQSQIKQLHTLITAMLSESEETVSDI